MKWRAETLMLAALAAMPASAQQTPPAGEGPHASSDQGERYDAVGYAAASDQANGVGHATLPVGSYVEVTSLDTGKTALFAVTAAAPARSGEPVALSADAMRQLGVQAGAGVRVRDARPTPPEVAALRAGQAAALRLDAPPVLLTGLRKALPVRMAQATAATPLRQAPVRPEPATVPIPASSSAPPEAPATVAARGAPFPVPPATASAAAPTPARPPVPAPKAAPKPKPAPKSGWGVQVAALSSESRAKALANELGGNARRAGNIWRIQLGPFNDRANAEAARVRVAGRGHRQAALVHIP